MLDTVKHHHTELISEKHHQNFSDTSAWIKRKLNFCLLRTAVVCIRGSRSANMLSPLMKWVTLTLETIYLVLLIN